MEITIISKENIKPSSPVDHLEPFKLSLLDQIIPPEYNPLVLFYPANVAGTSRIISQLKSSLSRTLTSYYPLSGRVKDNLVIHDYSEGVPFTEARVNGRLDHFLEHPQGPQLEMLNHLLPCQPFCQQNDQTVPQVAVQLNIFECGGIALGVCFSHKAMDGAATGSFMQTWTATTRGSTDAEIMTPNLSYASTFFPPQEEVPPLYTSFLQACWKTDARFRVRRFVLEAEAVAALQAKAKSDLVENPTKCEAISAFFFKHTLAALKLIPDSENEAIYFSQSVNIRRLSEPQLSNSSLGNLFWQSYARYSDEADELDFHGLVAFARQCLSKINKESLSKGSSNSALFEQLDVVHQIYNEENARIFNFSDVRSFRFDEFDFGWGKPVWVGMCGLAQDSNFTFFLKGKNETVEVWTVMDDKIMKKLECDPEFLAFATPNPSMICSDTKKEILSIRSKL